MSALSFSEWYEGGPFSPFIRERRLPGTRGVVMLHVVQSAGDLSDPPTSDMVLGIAWGSAFSIEADYGFKRFRARASHDTCFLRPPGAAAQIRIDHPSTLRFFAFSGAAVQALVAEEGNDRLVDFGRLHTAAFRCELAVQLCERMWQAASQQDSLSRLYCDYATLMLVSELNREARQRAVRNLQRGQLTPNQLQLVCDAMMARVENGQPEPGLVELASMIGLSPNHFCTAFRKSTGQPPHRWLSRKRVERAQALLSATRLSITEIALTLGYGSHTAFTAAFRRETGSTPSSFRRGR